MSVVLLIALLGETPGHGGDPMTALPPEKSLDAIWSSTRNNPWRSGDQLDQKRFDVLVPLFETFLSAARNNDLEAAARAATPLRAFNFSMFRVPVAGGDALALVDGEGGGGGYLVRIGKVSAEIILQTPHRFFDTGTGNIGREAFARTNMRAFFFNTAHRYAASNGDRDAKSASDMAHNIHSQLSACTLAAARVFASPVVIQLHGFNTDGGPANVDAVVSAGGHPNADAAAQVLKIVSVYTARVRRYPEAIDVLGGTENVQGRLLAKLGVGFVHLEMSQDLRQRLKEPATAAAFGNALVRAFGGIDK